ncbi:MAG: hypothetical protein RIC51_11025 [Erythrobacter sp.]|uniref:hypothetical protein n=1 Tax=Erythrobacter sp. TaxID=1042 RepID=UPI0032F04A2A
MAGDLIDRLERLLIDAARERRVLTYADAARLLDIEPPHTIHRAALLIEAMMRRHAAANAPQLASLVVSKARGGLPAPGYFEMLRELGLFDGDARGPEAARFHAAELRRCFDAAARDSG